MPVSAREVALDHYSDRASLVAAGAQVAGQLWSAVDPANVVTSWMAQVPELTVVTAGAQLAAAKTADAYLDEVSDAQGIDPVSEFDTEPAAFAGTASDGRGLVGLLTSPAFAALQAIAAGSSTSSAVDLGGQHLDTIVRTQIADAGRAADQVALTARKEISGYIRIVVGKTCSRCVILAGRFYAYSAGFQRHPRCDCVHLPSTVAKAAGFRQNPRTIYDSLTAQERSRAGWSLADQRAIAEGADLNQVTNVRGVTSAGGRRSAGRLTPDQIYARAGSRDEAIALLRDNGYLKPGVGATPQRDRVELAANKPSPKATGAKAKIAPSQVRPELERARTASAVEKAFTAEAERITGRKIPAYFSGSAATAREHAEGVLRGLERFSDANLRRLGVTSAEGRYAHASTHLGIEFAVRWSSPAARMEYLAALSNDVVGWEGTVFQFGETLPGHGFHPRNTGNPISVAIHEFGHILDIATLNERIHNDVAAAVERHVTQAAVELAQRRAAAGLEGNWRDAYNTISSRVSEYAAKNEAELVAEAFSDVMTNGSEASVLSREIFDLLEAEYRRTTAIVRELAEWPRGNG